MEKRANIIAQGTVIAQPDNVFGYSAWPSLAVAGNGDILMACSGNRIMHVCPFGKVLLLRSRDEGRTWSSPTIAIDTPMDDRDAGILNLGGGRLLMTTFNDTCESQRRNADRGVYGPPERCDLVRAYLPLVANEVEKKYLGSLMAESTDDGFTWGAPYKIPVTCPHGPALLSDGTLIIAGNHLPFDAANEEHPIWVYRSDDGRSWEALSPIERCVDGPDLQHAEAHVLQLKSGRIVLHIRLDELGKTYEQRVFTVCQSVSDDGGKTWTAPRFTGAAGAPPHLMQHSSGAVVCVYGRRTPAYGIQAMISRDNAESWDDGYFIWDEGVDADLGYPATVELPGGDLLTVYYAKRPGETMTSILWTRWRLP